MTIQTYQDELIHYVADLDEKAAISVVTERLKSGYDPFRIVELCKEGVHQVGVLYEEGHYYVAGLIMAGLILRNVIDIIQPELIQNNDDNFKENIIIGTVQNDIHDIGKNLAGAILSCEGFNVIDLGVDVSADHFIEAIKTHQPKIVALSCLYTTAFENLKATVDAMGKAGLRKELSVLVAGSMVDETVCNYVQADHWSNDAIKAVQWCKRTVVKR